MTSSPQTNASERAFRGLALVFFLTFVNLAGVLVTAAAIGGVEPWTRWQFIGLFGVMEAASGLANVVSPNIWRLPIAELRTSRRAEVKLAASTILIPHWGGLARSAAGLVCIALAGWKEGLGAPTLALIPFLVVLAWCVLGASALVARPGVAWPQFDVVQFVVRWGRRDREFAPLSIGASVLQFVLTIATIPIAKLVAPSVLYRPEIGPSLQTFTVVAGIAAALAVLVYATWAGRIDWSAPVEQQREAQEHA